MANNNNNHQNGTILLKNKYLEGLEKDFFYHLDLSTEDNLEKKFGDVKFVCMGGTPHRMKAFAEFIRSELGVTDELVDLCANGKRFCLYKIGPVISVSHGMGMPSLSILLHEIIKLLSYAKCKDPVFIRIGTSGGLGVEPGTVIISSEPLNGFLKNEHEFVNLGKSVIRPATFDPQLVKELKECSLPDDDFKVELGKTMGTDDFYEGQGRVDGAICEHTLEEKMEFLKKAHKLGVRNIEMESTILGAITTMTGIRAADVCATFLNRLNGDQVTTTKGKKTEYEIRPQIIVSRYIKKKMGLM